MKLLACFKIVPDLDLIVDEDWAENEQLFVDTSYVKLLWNCFDEGAMEMMLKLSDLSESFDVVYELNALTVGRKKHESFLKILYALGFSNGVRVDVEKDVDFCPEEIAKAVACYVKEKASQDVIFTGVQSAVGANQKVPYLLAEELGWPLLSQVTNVEPVDEQHLKVTRQAIGGVYHEVVKTPVILAVGNAESAYLRIPTLKEKMKASKKMIDVLSPEELGMQPEIAGPNISMTGLFPNDKGRDTAFIQEGTPQEKAEILYQRYLKGRFEQL